MKCLLAFGVNLGIGPYLYPEIENRIDGHYEGSFNRIGDSTSNPEVGSIQILGRISYWQRFVTWSNGRKDQANDFSKESREK